jgi:tol-pal system protein YbgF
MRSTINKSALTLLFALAVSPLLVQCASQDELNQIHYQLRQLNKKVVELETSTVDNLQKRQASSASQMDQLYQEFLQFKSDLEETGHLNRRLTEQNKELENAFKSYAKTEEEKRAAELKRLEQEIVEKDRSIDDLADQLKLQQDNLQAIQNARVEEARRKAEAAAKAAAAARAKAEAASKASSSGVPAKIRADKKKSVFNVTASASPAPSSPSPAASSPSPAPTSKPPVPAAAPASVSSSSGDAGDLYQKGKYREAYRAFEELTRDQENSQAAINARYMMGECLFALKEYDQAILDYQNIITNNPSSSKAPAAMLRQGMAFEKLNDSDTARILYQKLIASYKESSEAVQAQQLLDKM